MVPPRCRQQRTALSKKNKKKQSRPKPTPAEKKAAEAAAILSAERVLPHLSAHQMPTLITGLEVAAGTAMWQILEHRNLCNYPDHTPPQNGVDIDTLLRDDPRHTHESEDERHSARAYSSYGATLYSVTNGRHAYFVSPDMSALIDTGSHRSADVAVTIADLPSPSGIAFLQPPSPREPYFLLWHTSFDRIVHIQTATRTGIGHFLPQNGRTGIPIGKWRYLPLPLTEIVLSPPDTDTPPDPATIRVSNVYQPTDTDPAELKELHNTDPTGHDDTATFLSFVNMIRQQKLTATSTIEQKTRRPHDTKLTPSTVSYIYYHRTETSDPAAHRTNEQRTTSRHPVRGHWKRQWYPSQQRHHPIFVVEYLRGTPTTDEHITHRDKINMI